MGRTRRIATTLAALAVVVGGLVAAGRTRRSVRPFPRASGAVRRSSSPRATGSARSRTRGSRSACRPAATERASPSPRTCRFSTPRKQPGYLPSSSTTACRRALDDPTARAQLLDGIVGSYRSHPALGGYYVYDEVPPEHIADTAAVVAGLRARDPQHPAFVSLFPNYADIPDYARYVRDFVRQIHPAAIVYDYYPFLADGSDRTGFFANLSVDQTRRARVVDPVLVLRAADGAPGTTPRERERKAVAGAAGAGLRSARPHVLHLLVERERRFPRAGRDRSAHRAADRPLRGGTAGQRPGARVWSSARRCEVARASSTTARWLRAR